MYMRCAGRERLREQILEAAGVAVLMQGGPAYTYLPRVTEAIEALEAMEHGQAA